MARRLGRALGLPVHVVDDVQWEPGWRSTSYAKVAAYHEEWLSQPLWIIDGWGSWDLIRRRFETADTIIVVDFPLRVHYRWALQRQLLAMAGLNQGWPPTGCRAWGVTLRLLRVMRSFHRELRPPLLRLVSESRFRDRVFHLRSPRQLRSFRRDAIATYGLPPGVAADEARRIRRRSRG